MRTVLTALAATLTLAWIAPADAEAHSYRKKGIKKQYYATGYYGRPTTGFYRRPASVGPNGLCQRDTGTPTGQLNFRNRCDTEEFWRRMEEQGSRGRF